LTASRRPMFPLKSKVIPVTADCCVKEYVEGLIKRRS
jgi:hypothetical protein